MQCKSYVFPCTSFEQSIDADISNSKQRFKTLCETNNFIYDEELNTVTTNNDIPDFDKATLEELVEQGVAAADQDAKPAAAPKRKRATTTKRKTKADKDKAEGTYLFRDRHEAKLTEPQMAKMRMLTKVSQSRRPKLPKV
jgi:hypothetical protein